MSAGYFKETRDMTFSIGIISVDLQMSASGNNPDQTGPSVASVTVWIRINKMKWHQLERRKHLEASQLLKSCETEYELI